jgi:hypothetical protein
MKEGGGDKTIKEKRVRQDMIDAIDDKNYF